MEVYVYRELGKPFNEWFDWVLREAELYDYGRYPAKGMGVWLPYGFKLRKNIIELIRKLLDSTGHEEILLPLLIPYNIIIKESEHIRDFEGQLYWVTHGGYEQLDVKLALRPTSETSLSYMEALWIKSYKQLPKKFYQVCSIFRYETKATRPLLRVREVTTFKEAHTVHEDFRDSERQIKEAMSIYSKFFNELGIPYVISKRPEWDKFAGAIYTVAFDTLLPDGKALQIGSVHNLGQNFSRVFEVRIQRRDESIDYAWQTSYGISERVIASIIAVHGDSKGLVLPFKIAPIQVVIIPIPAGSDEEKRAVVEYATRLKDDLVKNGLRVEADLREDITPGEKFYIWELKGVPLRIDLGPRELRGEYVTVVRRDSGERFKVKINELSQVLRELGEEVDSELSKRAWDAFRKKIRRVNDLNQARDYLSKERGIVEIPWCGKSDCALKASEILEADALGTPLDGVPSVDDEHCPVCGKEAVTIMRYAKKY
ncbi:MAG: proline--tRNA ligase [Desulfurococcales archaeon]|nr:proline--tRNA ligase [Desulfurococcales archaeon]